MTSQSPGSLRGPSLFSACFGRRPASYSRQDLLAFHREIETSVRTTFREIGGPNLLPIVPEALSTREFQDRFGADPVSRLVLEITKAKSEIVGIGDGSHWQIVYNLDQIEFADRNACTPSGKVIVNRVASTVYGSYLGGSGDDSAELAKCVKLAGDGWGNYFTLSPDLLLKREQIMLDLLDFSSKSSGSTFSCYHSQLVAFTLLKRELLDGPESLTPLMWAPPGLRGAPKGCELTRMMSGFWQIYKTANDTLQLPSLPLHFFTSTKTTTRPQEN